MKKSQMCTPLQATCYLFTIMFKALSPEPIVKVPPPTVLSCSKMLVVSNLGGVCWLAVFTFIESCKSSLEETEVDD